MKKGLTRVVSSIVAAMFLLSSMLLAAGAAGWEDNAKVLSSGQTISVDMNKDMQTFSDFKVTMPDKGTLTVVFISQSEYTRYNLFTADGETIERSSETVNTGEFGSPRGMTATPNGMRNYVWNPASEKCKVTFTYNDLPKGIYYIRTLKGYGGSYVGGGDTKLSMSATIKVDEDKTVTGIALILPLKKGDSVKLGTQLVPADAKDKVYWTSSNTKSVVVSESGTITAKAKGSSKITANVNGIVTSLWVRVA